MWASTNLISCNFSSLPQFKPKTLRPTQNPQITVNSAKPNSQILRITPNFSAFLKPNNLKTSFIVFPKKGFHQLCRSTLNSQDSDKDGVSEDKSKDERDWTSSILLLVLWCALMYYVFNLAPNQTPGQDMYFLKKLLNLEQDDGFRMNQVLVSEWYIMGLWPLIYSMLLLPTGRSSNSRIPVWPFLVASFFGGAYALLPYFVAWKPPAPSVDETAIRKWPLNFLESKLTASVTLAAGLGIVLYAVLGGGSDWNEFYQYFRGSKFIHVMSLDFSLLSAFAPFWVYNDMTARKWYDKGWWLLPVSVLPLLGPALYLALRPSLSEMKVSLDPSSSEEG